jgi:hypothetical protein
MKSMVLKAPKPRNPFVAAALRRKAGAHGSNATAKRQRAARELRAELLRSLSPPR